MLGALLPVAGLLVFVAVTDRWYILYEEEKLTALFGQSYQTYHAQVRRWIVCTQKLSAKKVSLR